MTYIHSTRTSPRTTGAPNGSIPQNIFSSGKFLLDREIWKKCYVLGRNLLLGNSQLRVSEEIQKGCRYVATPSQS